ncbi:hypothetical protein HKD37_03G008132 [Glycine soja]
MVLMSGHINLIVHHKGRLERDDHGTLEYVDDEFYVWENCEVDLMTLWIVLDLCKSRGAFNIQHNSHGCHHHCWMTDIHHPLAPTRFVQQQKKITMRWTLEEKIYNLDGGEEEGDNYWKRRSY